MSERRGEQHERFVALSVAFGETYRRLAEQEIGEFVSPLWSQYNERVKAVFLPQPSFGFLRSKTILETMFVTRGGRLLRSELSSLERHYPRETLRRVLIEDPTGKPLLVNFSYLTSHNAIHHLYHIAKFEDETGMQADRVESIVEWGGGYGGFCKVIARLNPKITYTIVDTPLFTCIQWLYLSTVLGPERVRLIAEPGMGVVSEAINLLPLGLLRRTTVRGEIFIATWSLSESSRAAQEYVWSTDFFEAPHVLLAFQSTSRDWPDAERVGEMASSIGAQIMSIENLPGSFYAFC